MPAPIQLTEDEATKLAQSVKRDQVHRCPNCQTPVFVGELKPGSKIEVVCHRRTCRNPLTGKKTKFVVAILESKDVKNAST